MIIVPITNINLHDCGHPEPLRTQAISGSFLYVFVYEFVSLSEYTAALWFFLSSIELPPRPLRVTDEAVPHGPGYRDVNHALYCSYL